MVTESSLIRRYSGVILVIETAFGPVLPESTLTNRPSEDFCHGVGLNNLVGSVKLSAIGELTRLSTLSAMVRSRFVSGLGLMLIMLEVMSCRLCFSLESLNGRNETATARPTRTAPRMNFS